jgi:hypothetical protein
MSQPQHSGAYHAPHTVRIAHLDGSRPGGAVHEMDADKLPVCALHHYDVTARYPHLGWVPQGPGLVTCGHCINGGRAGGGGSSRGGTTRQPTRRAPVRDPRIALSLDERIAARRHGAPSE